MKRLRSSIIALAVLLILVGTVATVLPLVGMGQEAVPFRRQRNFYLTRTLHDGAQALTACAEGYHMASLWEIHDPSNLKYNTQLGERLPDSGLGPPALDNNALGWIRTGGETNNGTDPDPANCFVWTSNSHGDFGTWALLALPDAQYINGVWPPWVNGVGSCPSNLRVWCIKD